MVTWLPSITRRSERPCRKTGAAGLVGARGRRPLFPSLFFSVWYITGHGGTFFYSFMYSTNRLNVHSVHNYTEVQILTEYLRVLEVMRHKIHPGSLLDLTRPLLDSRE